MKRILWFVAAALILIWLIGADVPVHAFPAAGLPSSSVAAAAGGR